MNYNNNVPLGNQTIASTTDPIRNNFAYLQSAINQEHNFDITDPTATYHLQASMPNRADPGILPVGTNGMYYVNGGVPKYYGSSVQYLPYSSCPAYVINGTTSISTGANIITALPANSCGYVYVIRITDQTVYAMGSFNSSSTILAVHNDNIGGGISLGASGSDLNLSVNRSTGGGSYNVRWVIQVFTP